MESSKVDPLGIFAPVALVRVSRDPSGWRIAARFGSASPPPSRPQGLFWVRSTPHFAYQASKGAVVQMTRAAAVDLAPEGIRVNCILPGLILTEMTKLEPEESVARDIERTPLGRGGESMEVAHGALFLASDEASYVTGAVLPIDGGYTAQ